MSEHLDKIREAIVGGLHNEIEELVSSAVDAAIAPEQIVSSIVRILDCTSTKIETKTTILQHWEIRNFPSQYK